VVITDIRVKDEEPGLRDYEASFVRLLDKICDGTDISIDETGTVLRYTPGQIIGGDGLVHNCPSSRGITYFLEGLLFLAPLAKKPLSIRLRGITNGGPDVTCDTFRTATLPLLAKFGLSEGLTFKITKRGALPGAGGEVTFSCPTLKKVEPIELMDEGKVKRVRGVAYTTRVSPQFAARMVDAARGVLNDFLPDVWIYSDHCKGMACGESPGYGLSLVAETITRCLKSSDACAELEGGSKSSREASEASAEATAVVSLQSPEEVGAAAAMRLLAEIDLDGVVDTVHQPLILYYLSLSEEVKPARVRLSRLSPAAAQMLRHVHDFFGVKFQIKEDHGDSGTVVLSCFGAAVTNTARRTF
jgi:RNA 3'-terminal phosphate cyclase-like protein